MNKGWLYAGLVIAAVMIPAKPVKLNQILPVETLYLRKEGETIILETDSRNRGEGSSVKAALQNLKDTAPGAVYLDTTNYLLIGVDAEYLAGELRGYLKNGTLLCAVKGEVNPELAGEFLKSHPPATMMGQWNGKQDLELLEFAADRMILKRN